MGMEGLNFTLGKREKKKSRKVSLVQDDPLAWSWVVLLSQPLANGALSYFGAFGVHLGPQSSGYQY